MFSNLLSWVTQDKTIDHTLRKNDPDWEQPDHDFDTPLLCNADTKPRVAQRASRVSQMALMKQS